MATQFEKQIKVRLDRTQNTLNNFSKCVVTGQAYGLSAGNDRRGFLKYHEN